VTADQRAVRTAGDESPVVETHAVGVTYSARSRGTDGVRALQDVSIAVQPGETLGVVGESGSGKTTLGRVLLGVQRPTDGDVRFRGLPIYGRDARRRQRGRMQVVPQNPDWSLNPAIRVWRSIAEPLVIQGTTPRREHGAKVAALLEQVGLDTALGERRPHELSGGQRQRIAIARAMITDPDFILFDEAVTALDASVQTQVLNLVRDLQAERGFAAVFISHDLAAVRYVSDRVAVFQAGHMVEIGPVARFYAQPEHEYSKQLLATLPPRKADEVNSATTSGVLSD
jgi:ABC-type glutathione transport system ATPase component